MSTTRRKFMRIDCRDEGVTGCLSTGAAATGADTTVTHCITSGGEKFYIYNTGANTTRMLPVNVVDANCTDGWELPSTNTDNVGATIRFTDLEAVAQSNTFTVGTDPAFYLKVRMGIPDVSDYDCLFVGFVEPAAADVAAIDTTAEVVAAYDEKAGWALRDNAGDTGIFTSLAGADVNTDATTAAWVDDAVKTLQVNVSAAGAVTYRIWDNATEDTSTGAVAFSFANGTVVTPMIIFAKCANVANTPPIIEYIEFGLA